VAAALGCSGTRRNERRFLADCPVTIDAVDLDGGARFSVNFSVAVIVLSEVAIIALHAFFEMDVGEVYGFPETVGILEGNLLAVFVQPIPFAVVIEYGAENPAVAVKIGETAWF